LASSAKSKYYLKNYGGYNFIGDKIFAPLIIGHVNVFAPLRYTNFIFRYFIGWKTQRRKGF
jgi:hypothetical protein